MKLKILAFVACLVVFPVAGKTINVMHSGINWKQSTLTIQAFQPSHPSHRQNFVCFKQKAEALPITQNLYDLGFSNPDSGPLTLSEKLLPQSCFQQAGWYQLQVLLQDYAGNRSEAELMLTVVPSDLSLTDSTLEAVASKTSGSGVTDLAKRRTCTSPTLVADGQDECLLELNLRDRFGNVIKPNGVSGELEVKLPDPPEGTGFDATKDTYEAFLNGLYFSNNQKKQTFSFPNPADSLQFGLKAYVPSLVPTNSKNVSEPLVKIEPQPVKFDLLYRVPETENITVETTKTVTPLFSPWVNVIAKPNSSFKNFALLPLNRLVVLPLQLSSLVNKDLPAKVSLDWAAPSLETLWVRFVDEENEEQKNFKSLLAISQTPQPFNLKLKLLQPQGAFSQETFGLNAMVTYLHKIAGKNQLVRYPLSIFKNQQAQALEPFGALRLAASVEGPLLSAERLKNEAEDSLILAGANKTLFTLWREQVSRKVVSLLRGQAANTKKRFNLNTDWEGENIAYFKGVDVLLEGEGEDDIVFADGIKTLVVEDGNIHLTKNLKYKTPQDSLGLVALNSQVLNTKNGHLFVHQNVQNLVGSYFLDGALVSTQKWLNPNIDDEIADREVTPNQSPKAPLGLQLVLEGTIMSRNTLGGADLSTPKGLNGQPLRRELAVVHDLNYVRRYEPLLSAEGERLPDSENNFCFKPDTKSCYPNPAPMVIKYDPRVRALPPPGFEPAQ